MRKIVQRFLKILAFFGLSAFSAVVAATLVALRHIVDTPQPLESVLPGAAHIYRWRHGHIFYRTLGDEDAPPLVLLHAPGIGASAYEMRKIMDALARQYHVYALDLLGFGLSDHPQMDYSAEMYIAMCHDFLSEVVAQPATLLASGLSCNYAVIVAKRFPETCTRLVLISPVALFGGAHTQNFWSKLMQQPVIGFLLYAILSTRTALRYILTRQHSPHQGQISECDVDYLYATTHQFRAEYAAMAELAGKLAVDASQQFDTLQQPALVIWGARALNNTRAITGHQSMPARAEMALIQDAGTYVHEEYPALVVANILGWGEESKTGVTATENTNAQVKKTRVEEPVAQEPAKLTAEEPGSGETEPGTGEVLMAYCVKCKKKTPMQDAYEVTMKNGNPAIKGKCSLCGTGQHRMGRLAYAP